VHGDAHLGNLVRAAFVVPLGQAVIAAGGPRALADDPAAVRAMIRLIRHNLATMPTPPVPRGFGALQILPQGLLAAVLRRFLRGPTAAPRRRRSAEAPRGAQPEGATAGLEQVTAQHAVVEFGWNPSVIYRAPLATRVWLHLLQQPRCQPIGRLSDQSGHITRLPTVTNRNPNMLLDV
jgi:hypothetical protein